MNSYSRFCLYTAVFVISINALPLQAAGVYMDFPSFFYSTDSSLIAVEFGLSDFDPPTGEASLFSAVIRGRAGPRSTASFLVPYFSVRNEDEILFGFGDLMLNFTIRVIGDSLDADGFYFRSDVRFPTGSKTLYPYSLHSLDGGGGIEVRKKLSSIQFKGAATYTFVGERVYQGRYPYSNYFLAAVSANVRIFKSVSTEFAGYHARFKGGFSRWIFNMSGSVPIGEYTALSLYGGFEAGDSSERIFDSFVAARISFGFPPEKPQNGD